MNESNEVPTYQPPEGVHGPTLGRDLPDGCERLLLSPNGVREEDWLSAYEPIRTQLYWWRPVPLKLGDRVQLTGTVEWLFDDGQTAKVRFADGFCYLPTSALTRVVTP